MEGQCVMCDSLLVILRRIVACG